MLPASAAGAAAAPMMMMPRPIFFILRDVAMMERLVIGSRGVIRPRVMIARRAPTGLGGPEETGRGAR